MIYNVERIDRVIDKIRRDLGLGEDEIPYIDFIEWIADALQHIGAYYQFQEKECTILIDNFEGALPCDFYKPIRMLQGCDIQPGEGGFYGGTLQSYLASIGVDFDNLPAYFKYHTLAVQGLSKPANNTVVGDGLQFNKNLIGNPTSNKFTTRDYNLNFNKLTTAFRYGVIHLQYLAFPVDEKGWPLVPDDVSYRDALFWKVAYHLCIRNPANFKNPRMQDLEYCRQQWLKYCNQARASANMPDLAMYERLKNNWLRLHNQVDFDKNLYRENGKPQYNNLDGRY